MTLDTDIVPRVARPRRSTADELEVEQAMEAVVESALATSPSAEDLAQIRATCRSKVRLFLKKVVLLLLKKVLR
jgi:hypothetical protein